MRALLILLLLLPTVHGAVYLSEIMYNPSGNEFDFEYVELYGQGDNVSSWSFEGIDFTFPENSTINGFAVIANTAYEDGENNDFYDRYGFNTSFDYTGSLLNGGESIVLRDADGKIVEIVDYSDEAGEDHSLERVSRKEKASDPLNWKESVLGGTPGKENSVSQNDTCDWELSLLMNESVSLDPSWKFKASRIEGEGKVNFSIKHWVEDSKGKIVKEYGDVEAENSVSSKTSASYSPRLDAGAYYIKAEITNLSCSDDDVSNNEISHLFVVEKDEAPAAETIAVEEKKAESSLSIADAPEEASFGDIIKVKINAYRGDTRKYALNAYVEGDTVVSEKSPFQLNEKFTEYTLTIPIQLKESCNERYKEGKYSIIVEGMDLDDSERITLSYDNCKEESKVSFDVDAVPYVKVNDSFDIDVELKNDGDSASVDVESIIRKGTKTVSWINKSLSIGKEKKDVSFTHSIDGTEGEYNVVTKVYVDGKKTPITEERKMYADLPQADKSEAIIPNRQNRIIYESDDIIVKNALPYVLVLFFMMSVMFSLFGLKAK